MKTKMVSIAALVLFMVGVPKFINAETNQVDSITNLIKGVWYKIYSEKGSTGQKDVVYDSDSTVISRISGTDSITWIDYNYGNKKTVGYAISYGQSNVSNEISWKLNTSTPFFIGNETFQLKTDFLFSIHKDTLQLIKDIQDGDTWVYARSNVPSLPPYGIDSVCMLLEGVWYLNNKNGGYSGSRFYYYNSDSTVINRIPGTDSITMKKYELGALISKKNYLVNYSRIVTRNVKGWKLNDNILSFYGNSFGILDDFVDGWGYWYNRTQLVTNISNPNQANHKMVLTQLPGTSRFSISGITSIDRLEIRDLYGRIQRQMDQVDVGETIDISFLSAGIYLIKVYSGKETYTGKVIRK